MVDFKDFNFFLFIQVSYQDETGSVNKIVRGSLIYCICDNLGHNECLGLTQSFTSSFPCRFCTMNIAEIRTCTSIEIANSKLRGENYYTPYDQADNKNDLKETCGIIRKSCLVLLNFYSVFLSLTIDIFHDCHEGVAVEVMKQFFNVIKGKNFLYIHLFTYSIFKFAVSNRLSLM